MSAHPPPVPPDQRSDKASGAAATHKETHPKQGYRPEDRNLGEQGRQGAVKQNTTNKGYQQDR
jgi:hypothetical protein